MSVLIGQIFFRAASAHDALQLLKGMFGGNGLGLPGRLASGSQYGLPAIGHLDWFSTPMLPGSAHAWRVFLLLPVVWFFPNTQEIVGQVKAVRPNILQWTALAHWRPNWVWATMMGVAFVAVLWYMTDTSSFLYFQF
jgi:hypothetical protein